MQRLPSVRRLIERESYLVVHAPRRLGKTTACFDLARELMAEGRHLAVTLPMKIGSDLCGDIGATELAILAAWRQAARHRLPADLQPPPWPDSAPGWRIGAALQAWAHAAPRPLVLLLDELDELKGLPLVSILRQLRSGFIDRPDHFPTSVVLVGLHDLRDYEVGPPGDPSRGASFFDIKEVSLALRNLTADEVAELYAQHTAESGQAFTTEASQRAFELTNGEPWLVNALAKIIVEDLVVDPRRTITVRDVSSAKDLGMRLDAPA
jgi:hypothetical protein